MIILIGGVSHTGKTLLAQKLLEKYKIPYVSLDHLKMGLVRGGYTKAFSASSDDELIAETMWPFVEGIIKTAIENEQDNIIEGCYLPPVHVKKLIETYPNHIKVIYICFTEAYVLENYDSKILTYRNIIEKRIYDEERSMINFINEHTRLRQECKKYRLNYVDIAENYESVMEAILDKFKLY